MSKNTARKSKSWKQSIKNWLYPHEHNGHHPHAIRHPALALYIALLLTFNAGYNVFIAQSSQVLGFATAISQQEVIRLTNVERVKAGVAPVAENAKLNASAMNKAKNMFEEDYWAHYAPSGKSPWHWFDQQGYAYTIAGENLARDFDTSQGVINGWMNSPSHKANMLASGYKHIGIAVLNGVLDGHETTLVVQHFGTPAEIASAPSETATPAIQGSVDTPNPPPPAQVAPTAPPIKELALNQQLHTPNMTGAAGVPSIAPDVMASLPYNLLNPTPINTWSVQQIAVVAFLFLLLLLFVFDFAVLHRKQVVRPHSHSLLHAGMMAVAIVVVLYSTVGGVL